MLQYRENINYMRQSQFNIDAELDQLKQLCKNGIDDYQLYKQIRNYIYKEIKIKQLAVTLILNDLRQIRAYKPLHASIIEYFIIHNHLSYKDIADFFGVSKQAINQLMQKYAEQFTWMDNLVKIKGLEDAKNENNRSIFFERKTKKEAETIQLSIIQQEVQL